MIKGIIFDLERTLLQFTGNWEATVQAGTGAMTGWYLHKKRIKHDAQALQEAFISERKAGRVLAYQTNQEVTATASLTEALHKISAPKRMQPLVSQALRAYFRPEELLWKPYADSVSVLQQLKQAGYKLGLYANLTDDPFLQRIVNQSKLRPWLSPTFSSAMWGWRKPKTEPLAFIANRWQLDPSEIVVVSGTIHTDIVGGKEAGMKTVLLTHDEAASNDDHRHIAANAIIPSLATLPAVIGALK